MRRAALLLVGLLLSSTARAASRPNVLLIVVDALRADRLSAYGHARKTSPNLDALAEEGALFSDVTAQGNWTLPALASLMTSLYPASHGASRFPAERGTWAKRVEAGRFVAEAGGRLDPSRPTLARALLDAGYETYGFAIGGMCRSVFGFSEGFEAYRDEGRKLHEYAPELSDWLAKKRKRPFFMYLHAGDVHDPYDTLPEYNKLWDADYKGKLDGSRKSLNAVNDGLIKPSERDREHLLALYDGAISYTDHQLGRLFDRLRDEGVWKDTIVVVTADHGEEFGEHGSWQHGHSAHQGLVRVPLIIKAPGLPAGRKLSQPVAQIDVAPTILELANVKGLEGAQGRSLAPLWKAGTEAKTPDVFSEVFDIPGRGRRAMIARRGALKLVAREDGKPDELYDLSADGGEKKNLISARAADAGELRKALAAWREKAAARRKELGEPKGGSKPIDASAQAKLKAAGYLP